MKKNKYKAVCFDLDGVLIDSMPLHALAWQRAGKPFGLSVSKRFIYAHEGESGSVTARLLFGNENTRKAQHQALLSAKENYFRRLASRIQTHAALVKCLNGLNSCGVPLALVTGTSWNEVRQVVSKRILGQFRVAITGDRVRRGKPYPDPYQTAFRALAIKPREAIVIENAPYGIESARKAKAGFVVAFASSLPKRFLHQADWVGGSAESVANYLKTLVTTELLPYNK